MSIKSDMMKEGVYPPTMSQVELFWRVQVVSDAILFFENEGENRNTDKLEGAAIAYWYRGVPQSEWKTGGEGGEVHGSRWNRWGLMNHIRLFDHLKDTRGDRETGPFGMNKAEWHALIARIIYEFPRHKINPSHSAHPRSDYRRDAIKGMLVWAGLSPAQRWRPTHKRSRNQFVEGTDEYKEVVDAVRKARPSEPEPTQEFIDERERQRKEDAKAKHTDAGGNETTTEPETGGQKREEEEKSQTGKYMLIGGATAAAAAGALLLKNKNKKENQ